MTIPITPSELTAIGSFIQNIFVSGAAFITAFVAWKGLNKWRDETTFKANFELAKEVIEETYKLRSLTETIEYPSSLSEIDKNYEVNNVITYLKPALESLDHYSSLIARVKALFDNDTIYHIEKIRNVTKLLTSFTKSMYSSAHVYALAIEHITRLEQGSVGNQMQEANEEEEQAIHKLETFKVHLSKLSLKEDKEMKKLGLTDRCKEDNLHVSLDANIEVLVASLNKYLKR